MKSDWESVMAPPEPPSSPSSGLSDFTSSPSVTMTISTDNGTASVPVTDVSVDWSHERNNPVWSTQ